jgi:hypothetical protein
LQERRHHGILHRWPPTCLELKLIGCSVWERRSGGGRNVTFPARQYSVNGERRSFALLRPIGDAAAQDAIREAILNAYQRPRRQHSSRRQAGRPRGAPSSSTRSPARALAIRLSESPITAGTENVGDPLMRSRVVLYAVWVVGYGAPSLNRRSAPDPDSTRRERELTVRSFSQPRSLLRTAALVYFGPLIAFGALALFALGFGVLAMAFQLVAALAKHAGV